MPVATGLRSLMLAASMAALLLPGAVSATASDGVGSCLLAGAGTAEAPFQVATGTELSCIAGDSAYWTSSFLQTADVTLGDPAWPHGIGTADSPFTGSYDGGGHLIDYLNISASAGAQGLFGRTSGATITGVQLSHGNVAAADENLSTTNIGGLVGLAANTTISNIIASVDVHAGAGSNCVGGVVGRMDYGNTTLENVTSSGTPYTGGVDGLSAGVGGLVGCAYGGSITTALMTGNVNAFTTQGLASTADVSLSYVGGLVGYAQDLTIESATVNGTVTADASGAADQFANVTVQQVGGLVGGAMRLSVLNATALSTIFASATGTVSQAGGLIGYVTDSTVTQAHAQGELHAVSTQRYPSYLGGLVGTVDGGLVQRSSSVEAITAYPGASTIGGFAGGMTGSAAIADAYARGSISAPGGSWIGGFAEYATGGTITNVYTTVAVPAVTNVSGFIAQANPALTVTPTSYFDTTATTQGSPAIAGATPGVEGLPTAAMQTRSLYTVGNTDPDGWASAWAMADGWAALGDTVDTWGICAAYNDGYPFLLWEAPHNPCQGTLTVEEPAHGTITGSGITCPGACEATKDFATSVTLTATPADGYVLDSWGGACAGTIGSECTFQMAPGATVSAAFVPMAPTFGAPPSIVIRTGVILPAGATPAMPVRLSWSASAPFATIARYEVWRCSAAPCMDAGWISVPLASATATSVNSTVPTTGKFSFRIKATASTGAWTMIEWPPTAARVVQQSNTAVKYAGTWTSVTGAGYSGGSLKWSKAARATATFTFTGTQVALVTSKAALRGKVVISVDGKSAVTVDLRGATNNRVIAWRWTGSYGKHVVVVKVLGTAGRPRVDLDAFLTWNPGPPPAP